MKYYKSLIDLPGHKKGDILIQTNNFYMWETEPFYTFPGELVENDVKYFERVYIDYTEGENIWYITLNGLVVADKFKRSKHSSLIEYGNIFRNDKEAIEANNKIKAILQMYV